MTKSTEPFFRHGDLSQAEREELLNELDKVSARLKVDDRRVNERITYRKSVVKAKVHHPGGGDSEIGMYPRNLSPNGIGVLVAGFLHPDTECRIDMPNIANEIEPINGVTIYCEHLRGIYHLVGIKFEHAIDPRRFVDRKHWPDSMVNAVMARDDICGRILCLDDQVMECDLLAMQLRDTKLELTFVNDADSARAKLKDQLTDLMIIDLNIGEVKGEDVIREIRDDGFRGPIIVLSSETNPSRLEAAKVAGANEIVSKPADPPELMMVLSDWLEQMGSSSENMPIYSELGDQAGMAKTIATYIARVQSSVDELRRGIKEDDLDKVRAICQTLKVTGGGYGFAELAEAAKLAVGSLDASYSIEESISQLQRLELMTKRLKLRSPGSKD